MIFLHVLLNNVYMFQDAEIDLTYSRKLRNSTIEDEWLEHFPKINFKRVCILSGANASGKTVFGKTLCMINNYFAGRSINKEGHWLDIKQAMFDKKSPASFEVEFITLKSKDAFAHKLCAIFDSDGLIEESYKSVQLRKNESQSALYSRLRNSEDISYYHRENNNHDFTNAGFSCFAVSQGKLQVKADGWNYRLCEKDDSHSQNEGIHPQGTETIKAFLTAFDSSIVEVESIAPESYKICFSNGDHVLIDKGRLVTPDRLSRGTNEAIEVSLFYEAMVEKISSDSSTFYLDEMMAYSHTQAEQAILNLLIDKLPRHSQLFYGTHNYDVLDMNLPVHSHAFLKKYEFSEFVQPEKLGYNKNDRSLLGYIKNDVFGTIPNLDAITDL